MYYWGHEVSLSNIFLSKSLKHGSIKRSPVGSNGDKNMSDNHDRIPEVLQFQKCIGLVGYFIKDRAEYTITAVKSEGLCIDFKNNQ